MTPQQAREELQAKRTDAPTRYGLIDDSNILDAAKRALAVLGTARADAPEAGARP